ncbi:mannose-1-phosphate guanylyltransferase/mannose-6-phosphate isomerase [Aliikangiella sp. IMCC44359]|uniref:mannose-1-phosphate guanylyltransferase/mannose-6-phosphate isomerase n=1 Tax=Aliikangiella sp. IMCC44359 TaxID=3459125 RepID=UPI00403B35BA
MILPVIIAGGSGARLWPMSRALHPKQFLKIHGDNTLLQDTILRLSNMELADPLVICNDEHRFLVAEQMREIQRRCQIILEPEGKNTAPAIALAALKALEKGQDPILLVLAADHVISDTFAFESSVNLAAELALIDQLVTFGIVPTTAETGYGYIKKGGALKGGFKVDKFVEKPDQKTAEEYLDSGEYFWNSGMFMFKASCYLKELKKHNSKMLDICRESLKTAANDIDFIRIDVSIFSKCPANSIDYAVMEQTDSAAMVSMDAGWSDIGSWSAIWELANKDKSNNSIIGNVIVESSRNCLVLAEERLVSILGLENIVVVDTKDAILVATKRDVQKVKNIVESLKNNNQNEWKVHREVCRPWGKFDSIDIGQRYQVKRITVNPGAKISVQMHHHRAEHWVVVSGTAQVRKGNTSFLVSENESTYIPIGEIHSLENPGKLPLELIEVQTGSYLGEDDIIRLEDDYGRV